MAGPAGSASLIGGHGPVRWRRDRRRAVRATRLAPSPRFGRRLDARRPRPPIRRDRVPLEPDGQRLGNAERGRRYDDPAGVGFRRAWIDSGDDAAGRRARLEPALARRRAGRSRILGRLRPDAAPAHSGIRGRGAQCRRGPRQRAAGAEMEPVAGRHHIRPVSDADRGRHAAGRSWTSRRSLARNCRPLPPANRPRCPGGHRHRDRLGRRPDRGRPIRTGGAAAQQPVCPCYRRGHFTNF